MPLASSMVAGASTCVPGMCAYQPSRLCECCAATCRPAPVVIRITSGTGSWPPDMFSRVAALLRIWSRASRLKFTVMISMIGRIRPREADPCTGERRFGQGSVTDPLGAELLQQSQADGERPAIAADVLTHQRHPGVAGQRVAVGLPQGLVVGGLGAVGVGGSHAPGCESGHVGPPDPSTGLVTYRVRSLAT